MGRFERKASREAARRNPLRNPLVPVPGLFRDGIEALRQATIDATDFNVPWELFHDELAAAPGFNLAGVPGENQRLNLAVARIVERVEPTCRPGPSLLLHLGDFWHGLVETSAGPLVLYYFEREDMGVLGFIGKAQQNHLVRFSLVELDGATLPGRIVKGLPV